MLASGSPACGHGHSLTSTMQHQNTFFPGHVICPVICSPLGYWFIRSTTRESRPLIVTAIWQHSREMLSKWVNDWRNHPLWVLLLAMLTFHKIKVSYHVLLFTYRYTLVLSELLLPTNDYHLQSICLVWWFINYHCIGINPGTLSNGIKGKESLGK